MATGRDITGLRSHLTGLSAEEQARRAYEAQGFELVATRWRAEGAEAGGGEIDLILRRGKDWVFAEVKHSASHGQAASRITARQIHRIRTSAAQYLDHIPMERIDQVRLDAVLIDAHGKVEIRENALGFE